MTSTGQRITDLVNPDDASGEFKRQVSTFRDSVSRAAGARYPPQKGCYHLYVSYACPWAHRTLIARKLKGLDDVISYSVVHWHLGEDVWRFVTPAEAEKQEVPGAQVVPDPLAGHEGFTHLRHVYLESDTAYDGRFTVPVLYEKNLRRIINESSEILRMLGSEFDDLLDDAHRAVVLYPERLRAQVDEANSWMYDLINNGVYKSGFATTAEAYEKNVRALFTGLDRAERHLVAQQGKGPYYFGNSLTEVDIRLFVTLVRFDPVYVQHFKCNVRDIHSGYPALHRWLRHLYWNEAASFGATTHFDHIRWSYTRSHSQMYRLADVGQSEKCR